MCKYMNNNLVTDNLGNIRLLHGDCLELMNDIPDKSVDAIICDLPYGATACKWDTIIPFDKLWEQYNRIIKDNGAICLFGSEPFSSMLRMSNLKMYKHEWYWNKVNAANFVQAKNHPLKIVENIIVFSNGKVIYNPQMIENDNEYAENLRKKHVNKKDDSIRQTVKDKYFVMASGKFISETDEKHAFPKNIITISKFSSECNSKHRFHPTQKPVVLIEYLIKTYSNDGDLILDNTAGSMTTAIAAINTNRRCICIEKDDHYFEIGSERVRKHLQEQQLKLF